MASAASHDGSLSTGEKHGRSRCLSQAGMPQIAICSSPNLPRLGVPGKPEPWPLVVDGCPCAPTPFRTPKKLAFAVIETHLSHGSQGTRDNRTPYAVDATRGGRS